MTYCAQIPDDATTRWISSEFLTLYCTIPQAVRIRDARQWVYVGTPCHPRDPTGDKLLTINSCHDRTRASLRIRSTSGRRQPPARTAPLRTARGHAACLKPWHIYIPLGVDLRHSCALQARSKRLFSLSRSSQIALDNGHSLYGLHSFLYTLSRDIWMCQGYAI